MIHPISNQEEKKKIILTPLEISSYFRYGLKFTRAGFDPQSATLLALAKSIDTYDPTHASKAKFKTHYVFRLRREADEDLSLLLNIKRNVPKNLAYKTHSLNPEIHTETYDPYPQIDLQMDLYRALARIPTLSRRIVLNHLYLGHSLRSLSIYMGIPYRRLHNQFYEAIIYLQDALEPYRELGED